MIGNVPSPVSTRPRGRRESPLALLTGATNRDPSGGSSLPLPRCSCKRSFGNSGRIFEQNFVGFVIGLAETHQLAIK